MNVPRAFLAAVGAFWSELIPSPSLWDYEGAALADREAAVEVWEPSHADYTDEPLGPCVCECDVCESGDQHCDTASCATIGDDEDFSVTLTPNIPDDSAFRSGGQTFQTGARPKLSTSHGGKCKCGHWLHFGNLCAACGCASCTLPAAVPADEPPGGIEPPTLPPGLPFTFNAAELVSAARELIYNHYQFADVERVGELHLAHGAAELVVSQLVADLTAAYTEAQKPLLIPPTVTRVVLVHGSYPEQTVTERWAKEWDVYVQDDGRTLKLFSKNPTGPRYEHTPGFFEQK